MTIYSRVGATQLYHLRPKIRLVSETLCSIQNIRHLTKSISFSVYGLCVLNDDANMSDYKTTNSTMINDRIILNGVEQTIVGYLKTLPLRSDVGTGHNGEPQSV